MNAKPQLDQNLGRGFEFLHDPALNKGTAFNLVERDLLGLRGLLPPHVQTEEEQLRRVMTNLHRKSTPLERYIFLLSLLDRNETLFYRTVLNNIEEMLPLIYTPTVGQACQEFSSIFRRARGLFISAEDRGRVAQVLHNWPARDVRVIVATDGERILGLGDLGANGMGIPIGKLTLYTACAGIPPAQCLPVTIDVGTNNTALLADPLYLGLHQRRLRGGEYDAILDEFIAAATAQFPQALIQFEDFARDNAFRLLAKYRDRICCFNDDIQGTAAVALAGLYGALRITGGKLADQQLLFFGAGEAGTGIAQLVIAALVENGLAPEEARKRCWFIDSKSLVVNSREDLAEHKRPFAHHHEFLSDRVRIIEAIKPTILIGTTGKSGAFSRPILEAAAGVTSRPIIFALSNPTAVAECTAREAYEWTNGRAVFASGSPFDPVTLNGQVLTPAQGNNAYIFPGVGLAVIASASPRVTDEMFLGAAHALAQEVLPDELAQGRVYPQLRRIREVSVAVAAAVIETAQQQGLVRQKIPPDIPAYIRSLMYEPDYIDYSRR